MGSPIVIPNSVCPRAAVETFGGPAFKPLDRNGLGAQFLRLKGIGWGIFPSHRLTTVGAPFEVVPRGDRMAPAVAVDATRCLWMGRYCAVNKKKMNVWVV